MKDLWFSAVAAAEEREDLYEHWREKGVIDAKDFLTGRAVRSPPSLSSRLVLFFQSSKVSYLSFQAKPKKKKKKKRCCAFLLSTSLSYTVVYTLLQQWWWHSMESVKGKKRISYVLPRKPVPVCPVGAARQLDDESSGVLISYLSFSSSTSSNGLDYNAFFS
jgi:hypothetical protein